MAKWKVMLVIGTDGESAAGISSESFDVTVEMSPDPNNDFKEHLEGVLKEALRQVAVKLFDDRRAYCYTLKELENEGESGV